MIRSEPNRKQGEVLSEANQSEARLRISNRNKHKTLLLFASVLLLRDQTRDRTRISRRFCDLARALEDYHGSDFRDFQPPEPGTALILIYLLKYTKNQVRNILKVDF